MCTGEVSREALSKILVLVPLETSLQGIHRGASYLFALHRRDLLEIDTWFQTEGRASVRRDWIVRNVQTGEVMAVATR